MRLSYELIVCFLLSPIGNVMSVNVRKTDSDQMAQHRRTRATTQTYVVSHVFCESNLPAEDKMGKNTLEEIHTYAELKHDPRASLPDSFTICSTIMTANCQNHEWPIFFNILDNNRTQLMSPTRSYGTMESLCMILYSQGSSEMVESKIPPLFPNQWTRSCMAINTTSGLFHWVVEGTLVLNTTSDEVKNSKSQPKDLSKKLVLGARSYGGVWSAPIHKVTNLNVFSSALSIEEMKSMTGGESCIEEGDYLAWGDMEWILHGQATIEVVNKEEPCKGEPSVNLYYTKFPGMDSCMHHCQNLGTRVPSVTTFQDWRILQTSLKKDLYDKGLNTLRLWLPVEDKETEGEWRDVYSGSVITNYSPPWVGSKPDGGRSSNCANLLDGDTWDDNECDKSFYACMCTPNSSNNLELKGLCPSSTIDVHYKPISDLADRRKLKLQGLKGTSIEYDEKKKIWTFIAADSNIRGTSKASHASFTLGKHNWTIEGDTDCNGAESYITELKMSGCQEGNFTCNDGQCVSMALRCNQLPDCRDKSDERNCNILVLEDGYNMKVPPVNSSDPVDVSVSIDFLRLVDLNEEDYSIEIQFEITLVWKEKRATYQNLKNRDSLNALADNDVETLWLPKVIYENTDQKETTRLGSNWEWETRVIVRREEEQGSTSGPQSVDETEIFSGFENSLVMNQTYTHTFQCNYHLSHYPFDTQVEVFFSSISNWSYSYYIIVIKGTHF